MILVAGGTGYLGMTIVDVLAGRGESVRVLARHRPDARPDGQPAIEFVAADVRDRGALAPALQGVHTVVSAMHGFAEDPRGIDCTGNHNLIDGARAAGVGHFVLLSVRGVSHNHPIEMFRMKHRAEAALVASGLPFTIVRPSAFMETWLSLLCAPILTTGKATLFGKAVNPINFVSVVDVARLVEIAVSDPSLRGRTVEIGGPHNLSFTQFVQTFERVLGKVSSKRHIPLPLMRVMAHVMRVGSPALARKIGAGVIMETTDMAFHASALAGIRPTTLAELIRRDYLRRG